MIFTCWGVEMSPRAKVTNCKIPSNTCDRVSHIKKLVLLVLSLPNSILEPLKFELFWCLALLNKYLVRTSYDRSFNQIFYQCFLMLIRCHPFDTSPLDARGGNWIVAAGHVTTSGWDWGVRYQALELWTRPLFELKKTLWLARAGLDA
jgi:hypothetical protein